MNTLLALTYSFFLATMPYDNVGFKGEYEQHFNPTHVTYELGLKIADTVHVYTGEDTKQTQDRHKTEAFSDGVHTNRPIT